MKGIAFLTLKEGTKTSYSPRLGKYVRDVVVDKVTQSPPQRVPKGHLLVKVELTLPDGAFSSFIPTVKLVVGEDALVGTTEPISAEASPGSDWVKV